VRERRTLIGGHACVHVLSVPYIMGLTWKHGGRVSTALNPL